MLHPTDTVLRGKYLIALEKQMRTMIEEYEMRLNGHSANSGNWRRRYPVPLSQKGETSER